MQFTKFTMPTFYWGTQKTRLTSSTQLRPTRKTRTRNMNAHPGSSRISPITTGVLIGMFLAGLVATTAAQDQSDVTAIVADQVRSQGFACDSPKSAEHIAAESSPNETVYL